MSPLQIEIALHYFTRTDDFRDLDAPAIRDAIENLMAHGLLTEHTGSPLIPDRLYHGTGGLRCYVEALCALPLPIQQWVIPQQEDAA